LSGPDLNAAQGLISPAARDALQTWLDHQRSLKGAAKNTLIAYQGDVVEFLTFITFHKGDSQGLGALARITISDMRAWMARTQIVCGESVLPLAGRARRVRADRSSVNPVAKVPKKAAASLGH
jgi:hypothetical protein